jgi:hypothetical protein
MVSSVSGESECVQFREIRKTIPIRVETLDRDQGGGIPPVGEVIRPVGVKSRGISEMAQGAGVDARINNNGILRLCIGKIPEVCRSGCGTRYKDSHGD